MQRVTNCVLLKDNKVLLLQKPRRNWWVAPGGKMEPGESVRDSCIREFREETGIYLRNPNIKGIFTFIMKEGEKIILGMDDVYLFSTAADGLPCRMSRKKELFAGSQLMKSGIFRWLKEIIIF